MAEVRSLRKRTADGKVKVAEDAVPTPSGADLTRQFLADAQTRGTKRARKTPTTTIDLTADDDDDEDDSDYSQKYTSTGKLKTKPKPKATKAKTTKPKATKAETTKPKVTKPDTAKANIPPTPPTIKSTKHWGANAASTPPTIKSTKHWGPLVRADAPPPPPKAPRKVVIDHNSIESGEKRPKKFRDGPTQDYSKVYDRAMTQRLFVLDRVRDGTDECPTEIMSIAGSTGNIYTVNIGQVPKCNCPHFAAQCKHIVYAVVRVLHAPEHLQYQLAFLKSELREIFEKAPPIVLQTATASPVAESSPNRKPIAEDDDCPICCMSLLDEAAAQEQIVYCKAACGNNLHKECFDKWAATKRQAGSTVTCPYCRTAWQQEVDLPSMGLAGAGGNMKYGYVNIAAQLGLSGRRDTSTYHRPWVYQQERDGFDIEGRDMVGNSYEY